MCIDESCTETRSAVVTIVLTKVGETDRGISLHWGRMITQRALVAVNGGQQAETDDSINAKWSDG